MQLMLPAVILALTGCAGSELPRFERVLAANDSATSALGAWCGARDIAEPAVIRALADRTADGPVPADVRAALGVPATERIGYRHVRLACGNTVLSVAHNWYVPGRLTPEMNRVLDTTDTPFGKVAAPLSFRRERLAAKRGRMEECPEGTVLSHRAFLRVGDGRAISLVVECYTRANLSRAN